MKKIMVAVIALALISALFCGCGNKNDKSKVPDNEPVNTTETVEVTPEEIVDTSGFIGETKAKEIALETAGLSPKGVFFGRVELDNENEVWQYEVEFRKDKTEYEVVVNATDGSVISFETETID